MYDISIILSSSIGSRILILIVIIGNDVAHRVIVIVVLGDKAK